MSQVGFPTGVHEIFHASTLNRNTFGSHLSDQSPKNLCILRTIRPDKNAESGIGETVQIREKVELAGDVLAENVLRRNRKGEDGEDERKTDADESD
jgi:hypothetical protein